ncbi:hypothetical protein [Methyloglobulus sp.]
MLKIVGRDEFEKVASAHHQGQRLRKTTRWPQFVPKGHKSPWLSRS